MTYMTYMTYKTYMTYRAHKTYKTHKPHKAPTSPILHPFLLIFLNKGQQTFYGLFFRNILCDARFLFV